MKHAKTSGSRNCNYPKPEEARRRNTYRKGLEESDRLGSYIWPSVEEQSHCQPAAQRRSQWGIPFSCRPCLQSLAGGTYCSNPTRRQKAWSTQEISLLRHRAGWRIMESRYGGQQGLLSLENTVRFLAPRIQYSGVLEVSNYEKSDMFVIDNQIEEISKEQFVLRVARIKSFFRYLLFWWNKSRSISK